MKNNSLTGLVMCGGKSTRMGSDKGLLIKDGKTWAELASSKLRSLNLPIKISVNPLQTEAYQNIFGKEALIEDHIDLHGPLAGLLSACNTYTNTDFLIIACDLVDITSPTLQHLISVYTDKKDEHDFFVFKNEEEYEPLLGIYSTKGLQKIVQRYKEGKLEKHSMKYILEVGDTFPITIKEEQKKEFKNYNSL